MADKQTIRVYNAQQFFLQPVSETEVLKSRVQIFFIRKENRSRVNASRLRFKSLKFLIL